MIEVINFKNTKQCKKCFAILTFEYKDLKKFNQGGYEEYIIKCPVCGEYNQVCYCK